MARRRHAKTQTKIDWLEHRTGYPSPEEYEAILKRRYELRMELIILMARDIAPDSPEGRRLVQKYGDEEVNIVLKPFSKAFSNSSIVAESSYGYRQYRQRFARFGGQKPFLNAAEYNQKSDEHSQYLMDALENNGVYGPDAQELLDLLMIDSDLWEDITPEDIPTRPDSFPPPPISAYKEPLTEMLTWGSRLLSLNMLVRDWEVWEKHIPALTRMALDPALLNGWPSDKSSWVPWYAMHMLSELEATESAYALGELADMENDWLTDHLAHVWADMGMKVEPVLMMILDDPKLSDKRRGLAAEALSMLADEEPLLRQPVIEAFGSRIANPANSPTLTAYLIHFLGDLEAQDEFRPAIESAFAENRVDTTIVTLENMVWMEDEDWQDEDNDEDQ
jgi:hypothetical protein